MNATMIRARAAGWLLAVAALATGCSGGSNDSASQPPGTSAALAFQMNAGGQLNAFYRDGSVAAHLLMRSSTHPRLLVVFPAGNSGTGIWFDDTTQAVNWTLDSPIAPSVGHDLLGRTLYGMTANVSVDTTTLSIRQALLSSVRFLRDFNGGNAVPAELVTPPFVQNNTIRWQRPRADGAPGYALTVTVTGGTVSTNASGAVVLQAANGSTALHLQIQALTGETPLSPITRANLFSNAVNPDTQSQNVVEFLSYQDKLLAGSWQYDTYFGRDTLISVRMLMPVLQPSAIEAGLTSVLSRLSADGMVAHEEGIGEFAVIDNRKNGRPNDATPSYDYKMIDGDYMLAPIMAAWLIDDARGAARAAAYLAHTESNGQTNGSRFVTNLLRVANTARAFTQHRRPGWRRLPL